MKIVTIPDTLTQNELLASVWDEINNMELGSKCIVLLDDNTLPREGEYVGAEGYTFRFLPIQHPLHIVLCGAMADVIAIEKKKCISRKDMRTIATILNDHADDHGVLICPIQLEKMLK